ncbi:MAG TPA: pantoate--beta-alanine ligase [Acidobacteriaceae bacterium]|jgi:pantoate--beta-alanine ligase|nr:pantoate--beta-alanine ligase [Acidobacteriaceae bacterium]
MLLCKTIDEIRSSCRSVRNAEHTLGLVPTMGALHAGHLSLVSAARAECDAVVASIFVNPMQFGPQEDYDAYPRDFDADCRKLETAGVHALFAPPVEEMVPAGNTSYVDTGELGSRLDGASRPGHFRGVATIVARLFHIVQPDHAYFGQKDAAQIAVLRRMVRDLNFPVHLVACPIVREQDGLALSSRNRYLSPCERRRALILSRALAAAQLLAQHGESSADVLRAEMLKTFAADGEVRVDYAAVVDPETLLPVDEVSGGALIAVAAWIGSTRLIDNLLLAPRVVTGVQEIGLELSVWH